MSMMHENENPLLGEKCYFYSSEKCNELDVELTWQTAVNQVAQQGTQRLSMTATTKTGQMDGTDLILALAFSKLRIRDNNHKGDTLSAGESKAMGQKRDQTSSESFNLILWMKMIWTNLSKSGSLHTFTHEILCSMSPNSKLFLEQKQNHFHHPSRLAMLRSVSGNYLGRFRVTTIAHQNYISQLNWIILHIHNVLIKLLAPASAISFLIAYMAKNQRYRRNDTSHSNSRR